MWGWVSCLSTLSFPASSLQRPSSASSQLSLFSPAFSNPPFSPPVYSDVSISHHITVYSPLTTRIRLPSPIHHIPSSALESFTIIAQGQHHIPLSQPVFAFPLQSTTSPLPRLSLSLTRLIFSQDSYSSGSTLHMQHYLNYVNKQVSRDSSILNSDSTANTSTSLSTYPTFAWGHLSYFLLLYISTAGGGGGGSGVCLCTLSLTLAFPTCPPLHKLST